MSDTTKTVISGNFLALCASISREEKSPMTSASTLSSYKKEQITQKASRRKEKNEWESPKYEKENQ